MLGRTTLAFAAAMAIVCARAEAAVYTLQNINYSPTNPTGTAGFLDYRVALTISDAAVSRGSFNFSYNNNYTTTGDFSDFVSVQVPLDGVSFAQLASNRFSMIGGGSFSLAFDQSGAVTTSSFSFRGVTTDVSFTGAGSSVAGSFASDVSDASRCGFQANLCTFTGNFAQASVPEPSSALLLLIPVAALAMTARRRIQDDA